MNVILSLCIFFSCKEINIIILSPFKEKMANLTLHNISLSNCPKSTHLAKLMGCPTINTTTHDIMSILVDCLDSFKLNGI